MSQDIDRLIDTAFEHDRERLPAAKPGIPQELLKKASQTVSATGGASLPVWLKLGAGVLAIGGVTAYFATKHPTSPAPVPPQPPAVVIDSPIVNSDSLAAASAKQATSAPSMPKKPALPDSIDKPESIRKSLVLPDAIKDSTLHHRDSIRSGHER